MPIATATPGTDVPTVPFDTRTALRQMNPMDVLATSGGRSVHGDDLLVLPCRYGYRVEVRLGTDDMYVVSRVFVRSGKRHVRGTVAGVFFTELSETVYRAGCFRDPWPAAGIN